MALDNTNAVLYGGLLYDLEANDWEVEAKKYDVSSLLVVRGNSIYRPLPGSKKEVDTIEQISEFLLERIIIPFMEKLHWQYAGAVFLCVLVTSCRLLS